MHRADRAPTGAADRPQLASRFASYRAASGRPVEPPKRCSGRVLPPSEVSAELAVHSEMPKLTNDQEFETDWEAGRARAGVHVGLSGTSTQLSCPRGRGDHGECPADWTVGNRAWLPLGTLYRLDGEKWAGRPESPAHCMRSGRIIGSIQQNGPSREVGGANTGSLRLIGEGLSLQEP